MSQIYDVTDLGHPVGVPAGTPIVTGMNDFGQIVGYIWTYSRTWPFVWRPSTGMVELPHASLPAHGDCAPTGINAGGSIIGYYTPLGSDVRLPFRWDPSTKNGATGSFTLLTLPSNSTWAIPTAVNAAGHVLGLGPTSGGVLWIDPTQPRNVLGSNRLGFDLNDYGQIVGTESNAQAFLCSRPSPVRSPGFPIR